MKYKSVVLVLFLLFTLESNLFSQIEVADTAVAFECSSYLDTNLNQQVYLFADKKAEFPGGEIELVKFINSHLRFPKDGYCVQGTVYVEFVVGSDGRILRKAIRRSIMREMDEEAMKMIDLMPNWIPAQCEGKMVSFLLVIPVKFKIH